MAIGTVVVKTAFKEAGQKIKSLIEGWNYFLNTEVVVGITEETSSRDGSINNAELLYLHENGIPSHNIPPRPVLAPALSDETTHERLHTLLKDAASAALAEGNQMKCEQLFHKAGMVGRDACKNWIKDGSKLAPNTPETIARKGSSKPLIDKGSMVESITYAVRNKKTKKSVGRTEKVK